MNDSCFHIKGETSKSTQYYSKVLHWQFSYQSQCSLYTFRCFIWSVQKTQRLFVSRMIRLASHLESPEKTHVWQWCVTFISSTYIKKMFVLFVSWTFTLIYIINFKMRGDSIQQLNCSSIIFKINPTYVSKLIDEKF